MDVFPLNRFFALHVFIRLIEFSVLSTTFFMKFQGKMIEHVEHLAIYYKCDMHGACVIDVFQKFLFDRLPFSCVLDSEHF